MHLCYPEGPKTLKTAWEYYNEGTLGIVRPCHDKLSKQRNPGVEIIDREREKEWLEQMDTILIFVCHTSL